MPLSPSSITDRLSDGPTTAAELIRALRISQPVLSRAMQALQREGRVIRIGAARSVKYGLLRTVPGAGSKWPLFQVDEQGAIHELGHLHALARFHYFSDCDRPRLYGVTEGIPYFLQDQRPGGFLGRAIPGAYPELALPPRIVDWTDDHYLAYLTRRDFDTVGDLIAGAEALEGYLSSLRRRQPVAAANRTTEYPALANTVMAGGLPGSSTQGEHPKFTAMLDDGRHRTHVIVKFSPNRATRVGQRWADLLVAEHIAHEHLAGNGVAACRSAVFDFEGRTFLEVERFDRIGEEGRRGVVSLLALDASRYGRLDRWSNSAARLEKDGLLSHEDLDRVRLLEAFSTLVANTDRHFGNLTLFDRYEGRFDLGPAYDVLPMLFAPQNDQIVEREFQAPDPTADTLAVWPLARRLAEEYWTLLARDARISEEFRATSHRCLTSLRAAPQRVAVRGAATPRRVKET